MDQAQADRIRAEGETPHPYSGFCPTCGTKVEQVLSHLAPLVSRVACPSCTTLTSITRYGL